MNPDIINSIFESLGAIAIGLSIHKLSKDKMVRGISWLQVAFFALWGFWNIYYYSSLGQHFSYMAGVALTLINSIYVMMLIYYSNIEEKTDASEEENTLYRTGEEGC